MGSQLDSFKAQLEKLKAKGLDIDPDQVIEDIKNPVIKVKEPEFDDNSFLLARKKIDDLLNDYRGFYGPKGRTLKVEIYIGKENSADTFTEKFENGNIEVIHTVEIGTEGKYEPVDCVGEQK